jgi:hypothetical protein
MKLADRIASIPFRRLVWLVPIALVCHEAEEWNIMAWWTKSFSDATVVSNLAVRTWLVVFTVLGFVWTGIACLLPTVRATALMVFPFFILMCSQTLYSMCTGSLPLVDTPRLSSLAPCSIFLLFYWFPGTGFGIGSSDPSSSKRST